MTNEELVASIRKLARELGEDYSKALEACKEYREMLDRLESENARLMAMNELLMQEVGTCRETIEDIACGTTIECVTCGKPKPCMCDKK